MNCCDDYGQCKQGPGCPAREGKYYDHQTRSWLDDSPVLAHGVVAPPGHTLRTEEFGRKVFVEPAKPVPLPRSTPAIEPAKPVAINDTLDLWVPTIAFFLGVSIGGGLVMTYLGWVL